MQRCLTDSYLAASSRGFPHVYLTSQLCWTLRIKCCSHLDALRSFVFLLITCICMSKCMHLVILVVIRWLGIPESAEINSFFTISIVPIKNCWHCIIHTWIVFQDIANLNYYCFSFSLALWLFWFCTAIKYCLTTQQWVVLLCVNCYTK